MTPREHVEQGLRARKVSPAIIDCVLRLSAPYEEGAILRGIHYSGNDDPRLHGDCQAKGWIIRKYGRDLWSRIPAHEIFKRGRRKYATRRGIKAVGAFQ